VAFSACNFTELEISAKIHKCTAAFEFICRSLVLAPSKQILVFAAKYASVCLKALFTCTFSYEICMYVGRCTCVCAHRYVYSHAHIKHWPTEYMCINIQMGKITIFSVEYTAKSSVKCQHKEGIIYHLSLCISTLSNRPIGADFAIKILW